MSLARRTILLTLSLLVLMSSIGLTVGMHLCGGSLQNIALFHKAEACPMEQKQQALPCHGGSEQDAVADHEKESCCDDNLLVMESHDEVVTSKADVSLKSPNQQLVAILQTAFLFLLPQEEVPQATPYVYFSPPLVRDIPVLVQSFLI